MEHGSPFGFPSTLDCSCYNHVGVSVSSSQGQTSVELVQVPISPLLSVAVAAAAPGLGFSEVPDLGGSAATVGEAIEFTPAVTGFGSATSLRAGSVTRVAAVGTPTSLTDPDLDGPLDRDPEFGSTVEIIVLGGLIMDSLVVALLMV